MKPSTIQLFKIWAGVLVVVAVLPMVYGQPAHGQADNSPDHKKHHAENASKDVSLTDQIAEMRAQIAWLQARLEQGHQAQPGMQSTGKTGGMRRMQTSGANMMAQKKAMGSMQGMDMDGMQMDRMGDTQGMGKNGKRGSSKRDIGMMGMDGMQMMGRMGKEGSGPPPMIQTALPGFPGSSHLYHLGATGYFLDHGQHITLTREQQTTLNQIKERVLLTQATTDRQIEQAEQDLWVLTGTDEPDVRRIEAKVREIAKLKGDQRMAFIRAVGEAAKVLTDEQHKVLVGEMSPVPQTATSQPTR